jgi:hypothetical protein
MFGNLKKYSTLSLALVAFFFLTGFIISPLKVDSKAFGKNKTFAIVSIMATSKITTNQDSGGLVGLFKGFSKKYSFKEDSSKVFSDSLPLMMKKFQSSKSFRLLPKNTVIQNPAYQAMSPDKPKKWFGVEMVPADGYKYFKDKKKIKELAKEMNVDGIIVVAVSYSVGFRGANISGISGVGQDKGTALVSVYAVDNEGNEVWKHATQGVGKEGVMSTGGSSDFEKLHSSLVDASQIAAQKLIENLDKKVGS